MMSLAGKAQITNQNTRLLSLRECFEMALVHNLNIRIDRYSPEIARYNLQAAYGVYDPILSFNASSSYLLEPAAGGTRLTNDVELEPSSALLRPFGPLAIPRVKAAVARNLGILKQLLEGTRPAAEGDQQ